MINIKTTSFPFFYPESPFGPKLFFTYIYTNHFS